jgi:hypothetical protein
MSSDANVVMKKMLQKMATHIVSHKTYSEIDSVDVFFAFGSKHKTAMCDWVYGIRVNTKIPLSRRSEIITRFQSDMKKLSDKTFNQSVCCTDVIFESN